MRAAERASLVLRPFEPGDEKAFLELNESWIRAYFVIEAKDAEILNDPWTHILRPGGQILMAFDQSDPDVQPRAVGCCALIMIGENEYEVAKMCVAAEARGQGTGRHLLSYVIDYARTLGARRLYLETSNKLHTAIHLYRALGFRDVPPDRLHPSPYVRAEVFLELYI